MEFVKDHKMGFLIGAGVVIAAIVGGVAVWKSNQQQQDDPSSGCSRPAPAARFTTGAEGYGYGDANDIDGETSLIAGYNVAGENAGIGIYHTTWGANRTNMMLVVNAPKTLDGAAPGIKAEARVIAIPINGWEDSVLKDLRVDHNQQVGVRLPSGETMCVEVGEDPRLQAGMYNVTISPANPGGSFPVGFVIPAMNLRLVKRSNVNRELL